MSDLRYEFTEAESRIKTVLTLNEFDEIMVPANAEEEELDAVYESRFSITLEMLELNHLPEPEPVDDFDVWLWGNENDAKKDQAERHEEWEKKKFEIVNQLDVSLNLNQVDELLYALTEIKETIIAKGLQ